MELEEVDSVPSLLGDEEETVERFDKDDVEYADAEQQLEQFSYDGEDEAEKLATRFQQVQINENRLCHPEYPQRVCRGFYLCARDEELWKLACVKTWGGNLGKVKRFGSYRNMYLERPHLQFVGCYISKMSYLRQGEKSLDGFYSPWHQIEYYRYIRFFSEGRMFMVSTAEDPYVTLPQMKYKTSRLPGMMKGVTGVLKRVQAPDSTIGYKYKRNKNQKSNEIQYTYYVELEIQSSGKKNGNKLA
ncbi:FBX9-like protein [Mya arenaria]|uniref:FBX9-like protein n=1 Tax=Mya arenaria TaxID=6604 RepID=A0ABY7F2V2_MYAAR|nr:FBX9-like protein [Mya arenaria]